MDHELRHHRITVDGLAHHYVTAGTGRPLLLLHGFPQTWREWSRLIDLLADDHRIVAPDLRGLGGIVGPATGYDKATLAADVQAIAAAEFGDAKPIVCGHDIGAAVGFALALDHRDALAALILVDAPLPGTTALDSLSTNPQAFHLAFHANVDVAMMLIAGKEREYLTSFIRSLSYNQGALRDEDIDAYIRAYSAPGALRAALEMYRTLPEDGKHNLAALESGGRLELPVIVAGSEVTATQPYLDGMVEEISVGGSTELIGESGHWIPEEQPERLAALIRSVRL